MIIEKSHGLEHAHPSLLGAIEKAAVDGVIEGIWVQFYDDCGLELWDVSFCDDIEGKQLLENWEIKKFNEIYTQILEHRMPENEFIQTQEELFEVLEGMMWGRWNDKDTIHVETQTYADNYDRYGVSLASFC